MVVHKRKKVTKYRSHTTHGGGHRKKRRGAGSRGGRGNAGSGKRAGHKRFTFANYLGKKGFTSKSRSKVKAINLRDVQTLVIHEKAVKEGDTYLINLEKLGYNKLLGTGNVTFKLKVSVSSYSKRAEEKIKAAGGEIISLEKPEEKVEAKESTEPVKETKTEQ